MTTATNTQNLAEIIDNLDTNHYGKVIRDMLTGIIATRPQVTLGELDDNLEKKNSPLRVALRNVSFETLRSLFAPPVETKEGKKSRAPRAAKSIPSVTEWNDEKVKAGYADEVLKFISTSGLTDSGRGVAPREIRAAMTRGSDSQLREAIGMLKKDGKIASTGGARGLRWVVMSQYAAAQTKYEAEKAAQPEKPAKAPKSA